MRPTASLGVLADRRFAWFFVARSVSMAGSAMAPVALAFAVLHIDRSALALGQVLGVRTIAMIACLLLGGVVSDRFSRIAVLQVAHLLTCATQATAAALIISGHATLAQITVIEGLNGAVSAFTMPAMTGIVPLVVDRPRLQQANALLSFSRSSLGIVGPAVAGLLVVGVGPGWALAADALTYLVAVLALARVRLRREEPGRQRSSMIRELRDGWREFTSRQWLWVIVLTFGVTNAIHVGVIGVMGPLVATTTPAIGEAGWGAVLSAEAAGTVLMTLVLMRLRLTRPLRAGMVATAVVAVPLAMLGLAPAVLPLALAFFVGGAAIELFGVGWSTALHEHVPVAVLSRVSSYDALGSFVAIPVGTFLYGGLAAALDHEMLLLVSALVYAAVSLLALASPAVRGLRHRVDEPESVGAGAI
ncbi:MFS transporter [Intrasporangium sp.]|uniref:MFS transporter n=1 Tax=Intrasporangium sp. TaxID=1925024 RepID=UPI003221D74C